MSVLKSPGHCLQTGSTWPTHSHQNGCAVGSRPLHLCSGRFRRDLEDPRGQCHPKEEDSGELSEIDDSEDSSSGSVALMRKDQHGKAKGSGGHSRSRSCAICLLLAMIVAATVAAAYVWMFRKQASIAQFLSSLGINQPATPDRSIRRIYVGIPGSACTDAEDWTNSWAGCAIEAGGEDPHNCKPTGWTCLAYSRNGWCSNGTASPSFLGMHFNYPEKNCCECGGGPSDSNELDEALCKANPSCPDRSGNCCPADGGVWLDCCKDQPPGSLLTTSTLATVANSTTASPLQQRTAACAANPHCPALEGNCCPNAKGEWLTCCPSRS